MWLAAVASGHQGRRDQQDQQDHKAQKVIQAHKVLRARMDL
jgi:hypothetical protein